MVDSHRKDYIKFLVRIFSFILRIWQVMKDNFHNYECVSVVFIILSDIQDLNVVISKAQKWVGNQSNHYNTGVMLPSII